MTRKTLGRLAFLVAVLVVLASAPRSIAAKKKHPPAKPINLNTATMGQLEDLPGVGPVMAKAIVDFREKSGPFQRAEDLLSVHGISQKRFDRLRPYITVAPPTHPQQKPPPKGA